MPNINVKIRIDNIESELRMVKKHIDMHSGIPGEHAASIMRAAGEIARMASSIEEKAHKAHKAAKK